MEHEHVEERDPPLEEPNKLPWQDPKLTFVEPTVTKHGKLEQMTGFFGPFSP